MPPAMKFFQYQEKARRNTGRLLVLFPMAVAGVVLTVYLAVAFVHLLYVCQARHVPMTLYPGLWEPRLFAFVAGGVLVVVCTGTIAKLVQLRCGGRAVAESLGGRLMDANLASPQERKLLDVVAEMAIASGTPVPPVYVLPEGGINACAAGYTPRDAVIIVTRGAVEILTRDELQGVIAHEFSHILHGDMRLNLELMGVVNGILAIGLIGRVLLQMISDPDGWDASDLEGNNSPAALLLAILVVVPVGLFLLITGYVGMLFGNLVKAAVSRQREYLADASAVQFTRNPSGITGALKKIGGCAQGSRIRHYAAAQASHMFFGQTEASWPDFLLAMHPPLAQRILRIDPAWDGTFIAVAPVVIEPARSAVVARRVVAGSNVAAGPAARVGQLSKPHLENAANLIGQLPESIKRAAREPYAARALVYAMLISDEPAPQARQMACLRQTSWPGAAAETEHLLVDVREMDDQHRLPALDLAVPALRQLSRSQYDEFRHAVNLLIRADHGLKLFKWMVQKLVLWNLAPQFDRAGRRHVQYYGLGYLRDECSLLLSTLAYMGQRDPGAVQAAFAAGAGCLGPIGSSLQIVKPEACNYRTLEAALDKLNQVSSQRKQQIVKACSATVLADGCVTVQETELLRGILAILGRPMPPLSDVG